MNWKKEKGEEGHCLLFVWVKKRAMEGGPLRVGKKGGKRWGGEN